MLAVGGVPVSSEAKYVHTSRRIAWPHPQAFCCMADRAVALSKRKRAAAVLQRPHPAQLSQVLSV